MKTNMDNHHQDIVRMTESLAWPSEHQDVYQSEFKKHIVTSNFIYTFCKNPCDKKITYNYALLFKYYNVVRYKRFVSKNFFLIYKYHYQKNAASSTKCRIHPPSCLHLS